MPPTEDIPDIHEEGPSISPDPEPPVWGEKGETDACYDACARVLVEAVARDSARVGGVDKHPAEGADRDGVGVGAMVGGEGEGKGGRKGQPGVGVLFGTHNWNSSNLILEEAVKHGMAHYVREEPGTGTGQGELATKAGEEVVQLSEALTERVTVAQLYGMGDALSEYMTRRTRSGAPFVIRWVSFPYPFSLAFFRPSLPLLLTFFSFSNVPHCLPLFSTLPTSVSLKPPLTQPPGTSPTAPSPK